MLEAVIFDMDGVIADTERLHAQTSAELLREFGILIPPKQLSAKYAGTSDEFMFRDLFSEHRIPADPITTARRRWQKMYALLEGNIQPMPGAVELIRELKQHGVRIGLASGSYLHFIDIVLGKLNLKHFFDAIASGEEVKNIKPAPDVFLLAAERLGVQPKHCVVIEDAVSGMFGAKRAGMKCVGLVENTKRQYPADVVVSGLDELSLDQLSSLIK